MNTENNTMRVPYAQAVYGEEEIQAVVDVLKDPLKISPGERVKAFESKIANLYGKQHGIMVNSGSSANLLAVEALGLQPGDEVITPVLTFGTTVAPLLQKGLKPIFVDVEPGSYQIDVSKIESLITEKTRLLMIPSLLGNIPAMDKLREIADSNSLYFIEDSADTLGATFKGEPTGKYSDVSTTSFYASHIITAAATGGMVAVHDEQLAEKVMVLASWGRSSTLFGNHEASEDIDKRFAERIDDMQYDAKFVFSEIGYNMQSTEISAAFGLEQLKRLQEFTRRRMENFARLRKFFSQFEDFLVLPKQSESVKTNWLAFPLTIKVGAPFSRQDITRHLEEMNIQTRPVFTGNVLRQPAYRHLASAQPINEFPVADDVMKNGFVVGCHHGLEVEQMDYLEQTISDFVSQKSS